MVECLRQVPSVAGAVCGGTCEFVGRHAQTPQLELILGRIYGVWDSVDDRSVMPCKPWWLSIVRLVLNARHIVERVQLCAAVCDDDGVPTFGHLQLAQVQPACLGGGSLGCARTCVTVDHVAGRPASDGHQPGLRAT